MKYQIDQSGKIEDTARNTVIAYSNSTQRAVYIASNTKRRLQEIFRRYGLTRLYIYLTFATAIYFLIEDFKTITNIIIDEEYQGKNKIIESHIKTLLKLNNKPGHLISFARIGNQPRAHYAAKNVFDKKIKPNRVITLKEVLREIKKTDGRLRECLSILVGARSRSMHKYYHYKNKKSI